MLASPSPFQVHRQPFDEAFITELEKQLAILRYNKSPQWLGGFGFRMFDGPYEKKIPLPRELLAYKAAVSKYLPNQSVNTVFAQKYTAGQRVFAHRDPKNNVGKTAILVVGDFEGAETTVGNEKLKLNRGDLLVLACTIAGKQGPRHSVSEITRGVRYSFILNTITG